MSRTPRTVLEPKRKLEGLEKALGVAVVAKILGIHPRTLERRRSARQELRPLDAQREEKLTRIWAEGNDIFTPENAVEWLRLPNPALGNRVPLDVMAEDGGLDRVLLTLGRMSWGIPA